MQNKTRELDRRDKVSRVNYLCLLIHYWFYLLCEFFWHIFHASFKLCHEQSFNLSWFYFHFLLRLIWRRKCRFENGNFMFVWWQDVSIAFYLHTICQMKWCAIKNNLKAANKLENCLHINLLKAFSLYLLVKDADGSIAINFASLNY